MHIGKVEQPQGLRVGRQLHLHHHGLLRRRGPLQVHQEPERPRRGRGQEVPPAVGSGAQGFDTSSPSRLEYLSKLLFAHRDGFYRTVRLKP